MNACSWGLRFQGFVELVSSCMGHVSYYAGLAAM